MNCIFVAFVAGRERSDEVSVQVVAASAKIFAHVFKTVKFNT
jgi:hypothetical protein